MKPLCNIITAVILSAVVLSAEEESSMNLLDPALMGFGSPGFKSAMTASQTMDFEDGGGSVDIFDARVLLPVWGTKIAEGTFIGMEFGYTWASLDTTGALGLGRQNLQTLEMQFNAAHFPEEDEGWMGLVIVSPGLASSFDGISGDDFAFNALMVGGYQFSPSLTLSAAAVYFHSIGEDRVYPGVGVVWRPNDEWILQLIPPVIGVGWSPTKDWTLSLSAYPAGGGWDVGNEGTLGNVEAVQLDGWRSGFGVERQIGEHWRLNAQVGLNFGGELKLYDRGGDTIFSRDLDPSLFFLFGAAWMF